MEENVYEKYPEDKDFVYADIAGHDTTAEQLKYLLENQDMLNKIEHYFKGEVLNSETKEYEIKYRAMANKEGINQIMARIKPHCDKEIKLSWMPAQNVNAIMKQFAKNFAIDLTLYAETWGVKDSDIVMIWEFVTNLVYAAYCRGEEGVEKKFLKGTMFMGFQESNMPQYQRGYQHQSYKDYLNKYNPFQRQ